MEAFFLKSSWESLAGGGGGRGEGGIFWRNQICSFWEDCRVYCQHKKNMLLPKKNGHVVFILAILVSLLTLVYTATHKRLHYFLGITQPSSLHQLTHSLSHVLINRSRFVLLGGGEGYFLRNNWLTPLSNCQRINLLEDRLFICFNFYFFM